MRIFQSPAWLQKFARKNSRGGLTPSSKEEMKRAEHSDLITLPLSVSGTNCGNCKFVVEESEGDYYCPHEDVRQKVTERMCCKYWDHMDVKRPWVK